MRAVQIVEVKRHLDGREERFVCEVLALKEGEHAAVRWETRLERALEDGPLRIPPGPLVTLGYFWADRTYLVYKMMRPGPQGKLWGHRFDVCTDVTITAREIRYLDLIVDVWVDPRGNFYVLDEDELREARARGLLTPDRGEIVDRTLEELRARYREVLAELPPG